MRDVVAKGFCWSGLNRIVGRRYGGAGVIFTLHSIVDEADELRDPLRCPLSTLERALRWARSQQVDIVSLDEAVHRLALADGRPFVVITFDDGYRDNITRALPLLERFNAPCTIYVTSHMITRELFCWWDAIVPLVSGRETVEVEPMGRRFDLATATSRGEALKAIRRWVHEDSARAELLRPVFIRHGIDMADLVDRAGMTLEELQRAGAHRLVTIGGHTETHGFLDRQSPDQVRQELSGNKAFLEHATQRPVHHFAYPYGAAGPREAAIAANSGFRTAVTTQAGTVFKAHATNGRLLALPRAALDLNDTAHTLDCHARGVFRFLRTRAGEPVAAFA